MPSMPFVRSLQDELFPTPAFQAEIMHGLLPTSYFLCQCKIKPRSAASHLFLVNYKFIISVHRIIPFTAVQDPVPYRRGSNVKPYGYGLRSPRHRIGDINLRPYAVYGTAYSPTARTNGWSLMGKRCVQRQCFSRGERFSILPILTLDGIITYDIVPGSVTSERFLQFLRELVVCAYISTFGHVSNAVRMPCRSPFPIPTQVPEASLFLITAISITLKKCANLSKMMLVCIYQSRVSSMLMFLPDCKLIFLPPYSPDLNPIEQAFSAIKSYLRRFCNDYTFLVIDRACQNITSEKAWGFFRASGYVV